MSFLSYLLQTNLCLIVFYGFYRLFLYKETYFLLNRIFLVGSLALSLLIPALKIEGITQKVVGQEFYVNVKGIINKVNDLPISSFNWERSFMIIYLLGVSISVMLLVYKLMNIKRVIGNPMPNTAFSFLRFKSIDLNIADFNTVDKHEEVHIRQMHSLDILFIELIGIFNWFNPVILFYKVSIKQIHEYLADEGAAVYMGNKRNYAILLLSGSLGVDLALVNPFFRQSMVKQRIFMLQKERSKKRTLLKYGLFIPLIAGLFILSSATSSHLKTGLYSLSEGDHNAEFPGGFPKFQEYIVRSIKYPFQAKKDKLQGKVMLNFTVDTDGSIIDIKVVGHISKELDQEAVRVMENCPKWNPAIKNNTPVRVNHDFGINFSLD